MIHLQQHGNRGCDFFFFSFPGALPQAETSGTVAHKQFSPKGLKRTIDSSSNASIRMAQPLPLSFGACSTTFGPGTLGGDLLTYCRSAPTCFTHDFPKTAWWQICEDHIHLWVYNHSLKHYLSISWLKMMQETPSKTLPRTEWTINSWWGNYQLLMNSRMI